MFAFSRLRSVDGKKPAKSRATDDGSCVGRVVRFNYARHGAANGVVLDSGDFVHTKPAGLVALKLKVGSRVRASGDSHPLAHGRGRVVDAMAVNGKRVKRD